MKTFSINKEALKKIQSILDKNYYSDQVAALVDMSTPGQLMGDIKKKFLEGKNQDDLVPVVRKRFEEVKDQLRYRLMVVVYEKKAIYSEELIDINGIPFAMSVNTRKVLQNYCLTFEDGVFLLRSTNHVAKNLQTAINKHGKRGKLG